MTSARLMAVNDTGAVVGLLDGTETSDTVILSIGDRALPFMGDQLAGCGTRVYEIGDGSKVGDVPACVRDAFQVARNL